VKSSSGTADPYRHWRFVRAGAASVIWYTPTALEAGRSSSKRCQVRCWACPDSRPQSYYNISSRTCGLLSPPHFQLGAFQWSRAIAFVRRPVRLKIVDTDLLRGMHVPTRLSVRTVDCSTSSSVATAPRSGARLMIAPTLRSRFAQPSSRRPMPGASELSTVLWFGNQHHCHCAQQSRLTRLAACRDVACAVDSAAPSGFKDDPIGLILQARPQRCGRVVRLIVTPAEGGMRPPRERPTLIQALAQGHLWLTNCCVARRARCARSQSPLA
jgi:hypothetical protein